MKVLACRELKLVDRLTEEDKRKLYVVNKYNKKTYKLWAVGKEGIWIPRAYGGYHPPEDADWKEINVKFEGELRSNQIPLVEQYLSSNRQGIIQAGTGYGKTIMGIYIACQLGLKTLIIVPNDRIFHQWIERIRTFTNGDVGVIRQSKFDISKPFTVAMIHTLALSKSIKAKKELLRKEFGLVIYDEVHTLATDCFHVVTTYFWDRYRLGLTATPQRKDETQAMFFAHIGPIVASAGRASTPMVPKVLVFNYYNPNCSADGCIRYNGEFNFGKYFNRLCEIKHRTKKIAQLALKAYRKGRRILLLSDRIELLDDIARLLPKDVEYGYLTGNKKELDKRLILGTYGSAGLGLDIPDLDCLILATPRADVIQAVGRVLRKKEKQPIVIDFVDTASKLMRRWGNKRKRYYRQLGAEIRDYYMNFTD